MKASDVQMPEGIDLVLDPDTEIAVISEMKAAASEPQEGGEASGGEGEATAD